MKIACFYTHLRAACRLSLPEGTELVDTSWADDAYWQEIAKRWTGADDLVIIEHDMELHDQVAPQFEACREPWCTFPYEYGPNWPAAPLIDAALGCTKFSAALQFEFPAEFIAADVAKHDELPPVPFWHNTDLYIRKALRRAGLEPHRHEPHVRHLRGR